MVALLRLLSPKDGLGSAWQNVRLRSDSAGHRGMRSNMETSDCMRLLGTTLSNLQDFCNFRRLQGRYTRRCRGLLCAPGRYHAREATVSLLLAPLPGLLTIEARRSDLPLALLSWRMLSRALPKLEQDSIMHIRGLLISGITPQGLVGHLTCKRRAFGIHEISSVLISVHVGL